jgi:hypothetical protein
MGFTMSDKKLQTEGLFGAAKKFSDAFFDGLKNNATDKVLAKAKEKGMPAEVTNLMKKIKEDKAELDSLLQRISKL